MKVGEARLNRQELCVWAFSAHDSSVWCSWNARQVTKPVQTLYEPENTKNKQVPSSAHQIWAWGEMEDAPLALEPWKSHAS